MTRFILSLALLAILAHVNAWGDDWRTYDMNGWTWVIVKNPTPISNGNGTFSAGESCGIDYDGKLEKGSNGLLKFVTTSERFGTQCPSGTLFGGSGEMALHWLNKTGFPSNKTSIEKSERDLRAWLTVNGVLPNGSSSRIDSLSAVVRRLKAKIERLDDTDANQWKRIGELEERITKLAKLCSGLCDTVLEMKESQLRRR